MAALQEHYRKTVVEQLLQGGRYANRMQVPKVEKIVLNMGINSKHDKDVIVEAQQELATITGQKPVVTKAKKSISNFHVRKDMPVGAKVTLRGPRMYEFLDRLISVAIPRLRDFRGLSTTSFDGRGNYSLGVGEQLVFPEVKVDDVQAVQGMDITVCTTARTDEEAFALLGHFGMPFSRS